MKRRAIVLLSLAGACSIDEPISPAPKVVIYEGNLEVDIRGHAPVTITIPVTGEPVVQLSVDSVNAAGLLAPGTVLSGTARVEPFPETESELYTAKFSQPAQSSGPCGDQPVSLALSLHRRGTAARVGGALTAYCGSDRFHGVPVRMLRLSGDLPVK
jgi:hypothetical protein